MLTFFLWKPKTDGFRNAWITVWQQRLRWFGCVLRERGHEDMEMVGEAVESTRDRERPMI